MKKNSLLSIFCLAIGAYMWLGHSSGPGSVQNTDRTGSPLSPDFCKACHSGGSFGTEVSILLLGENDTITEYVPATTYTLQVKVSATGAEGYGFQAVALDINNAGVGAYGTAASGTQVTAVAGVNYFEHSARSASPTFEIEWTAPDAGAGDVTFYAAGNAVNANFQTSGDLPDTAKLVLTEAVSAGLHDQAAALIELQVSPNPSASFIQARWSPQVNATRMEINDLTGKSYYSRSLQNQSSSSEIAVYNLPAGIYFARLLTDQGYQAIKFVKI
jgi:hypothetical protein